MEQNLDKVCWYELSCNPNAIHILEKNLDKVSWSSLSEIPNAVHILEKNLDRVNWYFLSTNPNAVHLLFPLNTVAMRAKCKPFAEELVAYVFHPERMLRISNKLNMDLDDLLDMY